MSVCTHDKKVDISTIIIGLLFFKRQIILFENEAQQTKLRTVYLALYVLKVVDSVDGARTSVAGHANSRTPSNVVRNLSRDQFSSRIWGKRQEA